MSMRRGTTSGARAGECSTPYFSGRSEVEPLGFGRAVLRRSRNTCSRVGTGISAPFGVICVGFESMSRVYRMIDLRLPEKFKGPRLKIERAKFHLDEIEALLAEYQALSPYRTVFKLNPEKTFYECRMTEFIPPLPAFGVVIGEFAYQLRSALDNLIYEFSVPNFGPTVPKQQEAERVPQFPLLTSDLRKIPGSPFTHGFLKYVAPAVSELVGSFQPYAHPQPPTKPYALTVIEALAIRDKHRAVHVTGTDMMVLVAFLPEGVKVKMTSSANYREIFALVPAHMDPIADFCPYVSYNVAVHVPDVAAVHIGYLREVHDFVANEVVPAFQNLVP